MVNLLLTKVSHQCIVDTPYHSTVSLGSTLDFTKSYINLKTPTTALVIPRNSGKNEFHGQEWAKREMTRGLAWRELCEKKGEGGRQW